MASALEMPDRAEPDVHAPDAVFLEERVQALESNVRELQDTSALEERVTQRVLTQMANKQGSWWKRVNPFKASAAPVSSGWLIYDLFSEAKFLLAMLFDRRFPMAWASRMILTASIVLILTSTWWFPLTWFWGIGAWVDKLVTLIFGFFIFKVLSRETLRYRTFLANKEG